MATQTTTTKGKYAFTHSTAQPKSIVVRPKGPPTAGKFAQKSTRTRYFSTTTGGQVSKTGRRVAGGRTSELAKTIGKGPTPQAKAIGAVGAAKSKLKLPHSDKRTSSGLGKAVNRSPVLVAELMFAFVLIGFNGVSGIARNGYQKEISSIMLRFSAVTAIWFILFLFAASKRGGQFAAWLGFLIDLGILWDAVNRGAVNDLTGIITGGGIKSQTTLLVNTQKPQEFYSTPEIPVTPPQLA